jgi:hypothetical protein
MSGAYSQLPTFADMIIMMFKKYGDLTLVLLVIRQTETDFSSALYKMSFLGP